MAAIGVLNDLWSLTQDLNCVPFIVDELVPVIYKYISTHQNTKTIKYKNNNYGQVSEDLNVDKHN